MADQLAPARWSRFPAESGTDRNGLKRTGGCGGFTVTALTRIVTALGYADAMFTVCVLVRPRPPDGYYAWWDIERDGSAVARIMEVHGLQARSYRTGVPRTFGIVVSSIDAPSPAGAKAQVHIVLDRALRDAGVRPITVDVIAVSDADRQQLEKLADERLGRR